MRILQELVTQEIGQGVVLLVEGEGAGALGAYKKYVRDDQQLAGMCIRASVTSSTFFSSGPSTNCSHLEKKKLARWLRTAVAAKKPDTCTSQ